MWKDMSRGSEQFLDSLEQFVRQNVAELRRNGLVEFYRCHLAVYAKSLGRQARPSVTFDHIEVVGPQPAISRGDAFEQT
jgi:hypothetical protein